jgi:N-acetylmuramoyl-L-alanine amidase
MKLTATKSRVKEPTDEIWERGILVRPDTPIAALQGRLARSNSLAAASQTLVLQELIRPAELRGKPETGSVVRTEDPLPPGTAVLVLHEHMEWYLIAIMQEPWRMGWVERSAVRAKPDLPLRVNDEHYLETVDGRSFLHIVPGAGYGNLFKHRKNAAGQETFNIKYILMHYTTGLRMESTIHHFLTPASNVSTHLLIGRDGRIVQFVPFNRIAFHAGTSWWNETRHINEYSIGIELDNAGGLRRAGVDLWKSGNTILPAERVARAAYWKRPNIQAAYEIFPEAQLEAAWQVIKALHERYGVQDILGHDDVNLISREDPGPLLTPVMQEWRQRLFGRPEPDVPHFHLTTAADLFLNPGGGLVNESTGLHDPTHLPAGTEVTLVQGNLNPTAAWTKVRVRRSPPAPALRNKTGWVRTMGLVAQPGKGQTGGQKKEKEKDKKKKAGKPKPPATVNFRQYLTIGRQPFYKISGGEPTPRLALPAGAKVRKQEVSGKWTLVVVEEPVIKGETGFQGWVRSELLSG